MLIPVISFCTTSVSAQTSLWIPQSMLTAESYEGVVVLDSASSGRMIILSVDRPDILSVPHSVTVLPFQNHGIFKIKTYGEGTAQVFAAVDGKTTAASTSIHASDMIPTALSVLFASNKTKADTVIGYVLSVDARGSPATVSKDTPVTLRSTSMLSVDDEVLIKNGTHYSRFIAHIKGSGEVFATAPGLKTGHAHITKIQDKATVRIAVAPNIILENSRAYFYVWLEKDGRPFKPPYVTHAFVSSSDLNSIRFNENPHTSSDSILKIPLIQGVGSGTLISSKRGATTITASVEGFGSAQTNVITGPVLIDENFEILKDDKNRIKQIESRKPNIALLWVYPTITDSKAFGVIGLYHVNSTKDTITYVNDSNTSIMITNSINRIEPVPIDGRTITLTSSFDLDHPSTIVLSESNELLLKRGVGHNHAVEFQVTGKSYGNYTLSVAGPGLERFQAGAELKQPYTEIYKIGMTAIPALPNTKQDVAMFSIFDAQNALVDIQRTFKEPIRLTIATDTGKKEFIIGSKNTAVLSEQMGENLRITASTYGVMPYQAMLVPSGIAESIKLDVPNKVHIQEEFPYTVHEADSHGNPVRLVSPSTSTTAGLAVSGKRLVIKHAGVESFAVISNLGADVKEIEAFANQMSLHLTTYGTTNRVNTSFNLKVNSDVNDAEHIIDSPFPYARVDQTTYSITPNKEGRYNITVTALKDGYLPAKSTIDVFVEKLINIYFKAIGSDGRELHVDTHLKTDTVSKNFITPYQQEMRPQFVNVEFPDTLEVGSNGYQLQYIEFGDQKADTVSMYVGENLEIAAQYERMIKVKAENALGGGFYPYGSIVTLSVPPKDKWLFFVREVFDHWEGISYTSDTVSFVATENITAKAVLKEDHTFLMISFGSAVSAMIYFRFVWKKRFDILWYVQKIIAVFLILHKNIVLVNLKKKHSHKTKYDVSGIDF